MLIATVVFVFLAFTLMLVAGLLPIRRTGCGTWNDPAFPFAVGLFCLFGALVCSLQAVVQ